MTGSSFAEPLRRLSVELTSPRRLAIITHLNPDGDAMGSSLGLAAVLRKAGHKVQVVLPNMPPPFLQWLPGTQDVIAYDRDAPRGAAALHDAELVCCLDFNRLDRVGKAEEALRAAGQRILIDHHQEPEDMAFIAFSDVKASSTCQLVYDVITGLGLQGHIEKDVATCLYAGIMTDTGGFRFSSTSPHTHRVAAQLLELGVEPHIIHSSIMDEHGLHRMRLLGFMLKERLQVHDDLGVAIIALSKDDLSSHGFVPGDTEGFVNYGLSIRGVSLSALFLERDDVVKLSVRSQGGIPADRIMKEHFSGGGHRNAAGGQTREPMDAAVARFLQVLPDYLSVAKA